MNARATRNSFFAIAATNLSILFVTLFTTLTFPCYSVEFTECTEEEYSNLDYFFRAITESDGCGWVVLGSKPLCGVAIPSLDSVPSIIEQNNKTLRLMKGFDTLTRIAQRGEGSRDFFCTWYGDIFEGSEIIFVNKARLKAVIEKDIALFREKLGPLSTVDQIVDAICDPSPLQYARDILKKSPLLMGIVFGYGTHNSQLVDRQMSLPTDVGQLSSIPFVRLDTAITHDFSNKGEVDDFNDSCFGTRDNFRNYVFSGDATDLLPFGRAQSGLGFSSMAMESMEVENDLKVFILGFEGSRALVFGYIESEESRSLIETYTAEREKVENLLRQPDFTERLFQDFFGRSLVKIEEKEAVTTKEDRDFHKILAHCVLATKNDLDPRVQSDFIQSLFGNEEFEHRSTPWCDAVLVALDEAEKNYGSTKRHFIELKERAEMESVVADKLYYKVLRQGTGEVLSKVPARVSVSYNIRSVDNDVLSMEQNISLMLEDVIPGFSLGMRDMKEGERREIHIHPSLGYGLFVPFYRCGSLIADVTLNKIDMQGKDSWPEIEPLNLSWIEDLEKQQEIREGASIEVRNFGKIWRKNLASIRDCDLETVRLYVREMEKTGVESPLTRLDLDTLCRKLILPPTSSADF